MHPLQEKVTTEFRARFGADPAYIVRAPGRVNLIGEHTDYNDGFVLPLAIDRAMWIAMRPRTDLHVVLFSVDFDEAVSFALDSFDHSRAEWAEYVKAIAWVLQDAGHDLRGWDGVLASDVPIGAGLSSSAAIELATARAFSLTSGIGWQPAQMARLAQRAENQWVGVSCGIMDQMISASGLAGHALLIDCRSLETESVPLPPGTAVVVLDTVTRRGLVDSSYNERRAQCEEAARFFDVPALRDVSVERFEAESGAMDPLIRQRARHIITENDRTLRAAAAMKAGDAVTLGQLMNASHASLRDDYEVSSHELNVMVECAQAQAGCYGARMTGAGFGGCAVALVNAGAAQNFAAAVAREYRARTDLAPNIYICHPTNGAEVVA